ncbi:Outer envelope pore protein 16-3, chloroplastic/mitochondrial, partial [Mucuna pruriens]
MVDPAELRYLEDDDSSLMKTIKGATTGLVAGTIWGTVVATWYDVPRVERNVALPGLLRTFKMMGNYGLTFAAIGGVYIGVEQLVQNYRMKRDLFNGAVGGFVAGATILGYKGRSIKTALSAGSALAFTSVFLDFGDQRIKHDTGKEYAAYTTKKRTIAGAKLSSNDPIHNHKLSKSRRSSLEFANARLRAIDKKGKEWRKEIKRKTKKVNDFNGIVSSFVSIAIPKCDGYPCKR